MTDWSVGVPSRHSPETLLTAFNCGESLWYDDWDGLGNNKGVHNPCAAWPLLFGEEMPIEPLQSIIDAWYTVYELYPNNIMVLYDDEQEEIKRVSLPPKHVKETS